MPEKDDDVVAHSRTVVLVEGRSDQLAVMTLADRLHRDLEAEGVAVVSMQGATNIGHFLQRYGPPGSNRRLAGLCDAGEVRFFQKAFPRAGLGEVPTRADLEARNFFVCDADLEDELIRALGVGAVERVLAENRDLAAFHTFQQQPAQQEKSDQARLRRFMGTQGGRKIQYAPLLVAALEIPAVPDPLRNLLSAI